MTLWNTRCREFSADLLSRVLKYWSFRLKNWYREPSPAATATPTMAATKTLATACVGEGEGDALAMAPFARVAEGVAWCGLARDGIFERTP